MKLCTSISVKHRVRFTNLILLALFLAVGRTALASSTWYVHGVNGSDSNNCVSPQTACKTIGHAISLASAGDSIKVAAAIYIENLKIAFSLSVIGSGAVKPVIDGGGVKTVITVSHATTHVSLSKLIIKNGRAQFGGGINNSGTLAISDSIIIKNKAHSVGCGGGVYNTGTLLVRRSTIIQNSAVVAGGGGICNVSGGTVTINNSTLSGNYAQGGGGIINGGTVTINNSTISRNMDSLVSGGSAIMGGGSGLTINNSTINGNTHQNGLGCTINGSGLTLSNTTISGNVAGNGYVVLCATATLQNSIIANNSGGNCGSGVVSNGYNLSSDGSCNFSNSGDRNNTDAKLGPLQNNGGLTQTMALLPGSPAIDAGNPSGCTTGHGTLLTTDQRGALRPDKQAGRCDMGAFERQKG